MLMDINKLENRNCVLCGEEENSVLFSGKDRLHNFPGDFFVAKCANCGSVYLNPCPKKEDIGKFYPENYYSYSSLGEKSESFSGRLWKNIILNNYPRISKKETNFLINILSILLKSKVGGLPNYVEGGKILDVGCGSGKFLKVLKEAGWDVYGNEISLEAVERGKKEGLNLFCGELEDVKFPDSYFDALRIWHVLEHSYNPIKLVEECRRILKKGGEVLIGVPNFAGAYSRIFRQYWYNLDLPRHLFQFSPLILKKILTENGFRIQEIRYLSGGGFAGSLSHFINEKFKLRTDFTKSALAVYLFYIFDILIDALKIGDCMFIRAVKGEIK